MKNKKNRLLFLKVSIFVLIVVALLMFFVVPKISIWVVKEPEEERIFLPLIDEGSELDYLGYKYSNGSGIIVLTKKDVSCSLKPEDFEDGWKSCEAVFEIEDQRNLGQVLSSLDVELIFADKDEVRNVEILFSQDFVVEEEVYEEISKQVSHEKISETAVGVLDEGKLSKPMQRRLSKQREKRTRKKVVVSKNIQEFRKRTFIDFSDFPENVENVSLNVLEQNITNIEEDNASELDQYVNDSSQSSLEEGVPPFTSGENSSEQDVLENNSAQNPLVNESRNESVEDESETIEEIIEEVVEDTEEPEDVVTEVEPVEEIEEEPESAVEGEVVEEIEEEPEEIVEVEEEIVEVTEEVGAVEEVEESGGGLMGLVSNYLLALLGIEKSSELPLSRTGLDPLSGFAKIFGEGYRNILLKTDEPFAIKVSFEIPINQGNNFDFKISGENFEAFIDPDVGSCGTLDVENGVYALSQDVSSTGTCFTISADNVTLDCQGYLINHTSSSAGYGVYVSSDYARIRNCVIAEENGGSSSGGIFLLNSDNLEIINNSILILGDALSAVYLDTSTNNLLSGNIIDALGEGSMGFYLYSTSSSNSLIGNNVTAVQDDGIAVYLSDDSNFCVISNSNLTTSGGDAYGIMLEGAFNTNISNNLIKTFGEYSSGILAESSSNLNITLNNISTFESNSEGIYFITIENSEVSNNNLSTYESSSSHGLYATWSSSLDVLSNVVEVNSETASGIYLASSSSNNRLENNEINVSHDFSYGIYLHSSSGSNNVSENTIFTSGEEEAFAVVIDSVDSNLIKNNNLATFGRDGCGLYVYDADYNLINNNTVETLGDDAFGFYIDFYSNNNFSGNIITTFGSNAHGIFSHLDNNDFFSDEQVSTNSYSIYVNNNGNNLTFEDCSLDSSSDLFIKPNVNSGNWNFTNATLDNEVWSDGANGTLNAHWYVFVVSNYSNGSEVGSNVSIWDNEELFSEGSVETQILLGYSQNSSERSYVEYIINSTIVDDAMSQSFNLSENKNIVFTFTVPEVAVESDGSLGGGGGGGGVVSSKCKPDWNCGAWSDCINKKQTRTCEDSNNCNSDKKKPRVKRKCKVKPAPKKRSRNVLFDIKLEVLKSESSLGKISSAVSLINVGAPGRVEVLVDYKVKNNVGEIVYEETEKVPVETQIEFIKEIDISDLPDGGYSLVANLRYEGQVEPANAGGGFFIGEGSLMSRFSQSIILIIVVVLVAVFVLLGIRFRKNFFHFFTKEKVDSNNQINNKINKASIISCNN